MNRDDREYLDSIARIGCIVCKNEGYGHSPAEVHHCRRNPETGERYGTSQRAPHRYAIGLCARHHRSGGRGVALHAGQGLWERTFGTESELWAEVQGLLDLSCECPAIAQNQPQDRLNGVEP